MKNHKGIETRLRTLMGEDLDLQSDEQVLITLKRKYNIYLPQRKCLYDALRNSNSDHEVVNLLLQHRSSEVSSMPASQIH